MNLLDSVILGLIQGLTEFLPISSSGHLTLAQGFLGKVAVDQPLFFEVWVHAATLIAVVLFFRRDLWQLFRDVFTGRGRRDMVEAPLAADAAGGDELLSGGWLLIGALIIGTIPAAIAGLTLEDFIEERLATPVAAGAMLLVTAAVLLMSLFERPEKRRLTLVLALLVGCAQAAALPPGISRSGVTITTAILLGLSRTEAVRFSFLLSIPTIAGAVVLKLAEEGIPAGLGFGQLAAAALAAFLSGYAAIFLVKRFVEAGHLHYFSPYCVIVGMGGIWYFS